MSVDSQDGWPRSQIGSDQELSMEAAKIRSLLDYSRVLELEFEKALSKKLWISALVVGQSLVECFLLMRALSSIETIQNHSKYKHKNITGELLCSNKWGVQQLGRLALDLNWLDVRHVPVEIKNALISSLRTHLPQFKIPQSSAFVPTFMLFLVKEQRNLIHPGKLARTNSGLDAKRFLEEAEGHAIMLSIAIRCFKDTQNYDSLS